MNLDLDADPARNGRRVKPPVKGAAVSADPGPGRDPVEVADAPGPVTREALGSAVNPVERPPAAHRTPPSGGEGTQGRYRLLGPPVETASGAVYAAEHVLTGRRGVLLHAFPGAGADDPAVRVRLHGRAELSVAAAESSAHVLAVQDRGSLDDGRLFIVTERLEGSSLEDLLREEGVLPIARALALAAQIAEGLEAAHEVGLFHGRLDGSRVIVTDPPERVVLTGWEGDVGSGVAEAWLGPNVSSEQQDVVACAALFYRMVTGLAPLGEEGAEEGRRRPRSLRKLSPELPRRLSRLVTRLLDRRPTRRRPHLGALMNALRLELARLEAQDASPGAPRRWGIAAGLALAAGLVVVALTWWTVELDHPSFPGPEPAPPPSALPSIVERPAALPTEPEPVAGRAALPPPSAEPSQIIPREPVPAAQAVQPPSPPATSSARAAPPPAPVRPQPAARPPASLDAERPRTTPAPDQSGEPDPGAIIDWVLRNR